ncbi:unnamed protein product [marine sediment metagenome]|uniref:Uncharacterized protein n=1 Tax=marine sediment metagenome TaxID=412755 RepID=X1DRP7_9ZZZZ
MYVLRSYPAGFDNLGGITESVYGTTKHAIIHREAVKQVVALTRVPQGIVVVVFIGALV